MKLIKIAKHICYEDGNPVISPELNEAISEAELCERKAKAFDWLTAEGCIVGISEGKYSCLDVTQCGDERGIGKSELEAVESAMNQSAQSEGE